MNMRALAFSLLLTGTFAAQTDAFDMPMDSTMGSSVVTSSRGIVGEALNSNDGPIVPAGTGEAAQGMIERLGAQAMATIVDAAQDTAQKKQTFRTLLTTNFDLKTIGKFAMGKFWKQATPEQQAEYLKLYEKMIIDVYTARFQNYSGQKFKVTDHRLDDSGDIVVNSTVTGGGSPVSVAWRVRPKGNSYKIIDVMVEGVSMGVTQRNDFAGVIQQGGNNVDALLEYLRKGGVSDVDN